MSYLIDTDWAIDHLHNVERVARRLEQLAPEGLGVSIISLAELYEGIFNSTDPAGNEQALQDFLSGVEVVPVDEETCRIFGRERGRLRREGKMIADFDLLIGSTCLRHNLTLLSNNRRHFDQVEGLEIISIQEGDTR
jgi:tRNA(fMet)-specific endonuclease VapC